MVDDFEIRIVGKFKLEEWEDVNYCEHRFYKGEEPMSDDEVLNLLSELTEENEELRKQNKKLYKLALYGKTIEDTL